MSHEIRFEDEMLNEHIRRAKKEMPIGHFELAEVDRLIDGIHRGRLIVLAGEPGASKTTLLGQLADEAASSGFICIVNTLEIAAHQWIAKSLARINGDALTISSIADSNMESAIRDAAAVYMSTIAPNMIFIEDPLTPVELGASVAKVQRTSNKPVMLFHDYLQIMPSDTEQPVNDERLAIKQSIMGLRRIANAHDVPVMTVSSVNRSNYGKRSPGLDALGGAAAIEYSADTILHLHVEDEKADENKEAGLMRRLEVTTLKNRYAAKGSAMLRLDSTHATFTGGE